nr:MFS transporter [Amycolatopsis sp. GM8]
MRVIFSGRRGALLVALLFTEFGGAVQSIAYSSVLPIAAADLHGTNLYGATLAAGSFTQILILAIGSAPFARLRPLALVSMATALFIVGSVLAVAAVTMPMILIGTIVRGIAGGMLAGFGLSILGGLFDDNERTSVYGLFAMMWLLPSLVGPVVNAAVTIAWGWRAALAWPAVLVVIGRILIGQKINLVPWKTSTAARPSLTWVTALLGGLVLATFAALPKGNTGIILLVTGCVLATTASLRILRLQVGPERARLGKIVLLFLLCLCYFGGAGIVSLAMIAGLGHGIVAGTMAVGAGLLAWSLTGFKPELADRWLPKPQFVGLILVTTGLLAAVFTQTFIGGTTALVILIAGWFVSGVGMGGGRVRGAGHRDRWFHRRRDLCTGPVTRVVPDRIAELGLLAPRRLRRRLDRAAPAAVARMSRGGRPGLRGNDSVLDVGEQELDAARGEVEGVAGDGAALLGLEGRHRGGVVGEVQVGGAPARRRGAVLLREDLAVLRPQQVRHLRDELLVLLVAALELLRVDGVRVDEGELDGHRGLLR